MSTPLSISYYSDVLCVWAYIAELRNHELTSRWAGQISLDYHLLDLFADTQTRVGQGWMDRGGYQGFAAHVREAVRPFALPIHDDVWSRVRPTTSANAHLVIKALELCSGKAAGRELATQIRTAFFERAEDIGELGVLEDLVRNMGHSPDDVRLCMRNGRAIASLLADTKGAAEMRIQGSPTWVLNEGRQTLYGNIGYRVLHANVEELLRAPKQQATWC